jgi:hypothetical protein
MLVSHDPNGNRAGLLVEMFEGSSTFAFDRIRFHDRYRWMLQIIRPYFRWVGCCVRTRLRLATRKINGLTH